MLEKVRRGESERSKQKYKELWKVINEMSGRKRVREGLPGGYSPEKRITWFIYFRDLLGTHPEVDRG